jgi:hypothetical protein
MASKDVIALKYLETKTPLDLVEKITLACKGTFGYSFVDEDGLNVSAVAGHPDAKGLVETQDQMKTQTLYFFGEKAPALDEDLQPWEMLRNSKNEIVCAGFFEGDFGVSKPDSSHTAAYHVQQALARKLRMALKSLKDNTQELYEHCKSEDFQEEVKELFMGDGSIVLHFSNNQILWFCSPVERKHTTPFGMFSDLCGWEAPKALPDGVHTVPEKKTTAKGLDKIAALMAAKTHKNTDTAAEEHISPPPQKERTSDVPKVPQTPSTGPTTYQGILATKSLSLLGEDKVASFLKNGGRFRHVENWYMSVGNNSWPAGHSKASVMETWNKIKEHEKDGTWKDYVKELPGVLGSKARKEAKEEYEVLVASGHATDVGDRVVTANVVSGSSKETVTKVVTPMEGVSADGEFLPTISEGSQVKLQEMKDKFFDKSHKAIPIDPTKLKAYLDKYPNILEKMGVKSWSDMFGLPLEAFQMIAQRHDLARLCMFSMITEIERLQKLVPASQQAPASDSTKSMLAGLPGARKRA